MVLWKAELGYDPSGWVNAEGSWSYQPVSRQHTYPTPKPLLLEFFHCSTPLTSKPPKLDTSHFPELSDGAALRTCPFSGFHLYSSLPRLMPWILDVHNPASSPKLASLQGHLAYVSCLCIPATNWELGPNRPSIGRQVNGFSCKTEIYSGMQ